MTKKIILVVIMLYSFQSLSECTKLSGMLADKRMNMNVLKMFDRFFYLRHKDTFFIRNFQERLTDQYLRSYYGELVMTRSLKIDLGMHATYLENTVWHTSSITELFTVLYTKYLAANYIISFRNCHWYYTCGERDEEMATKCKKVTNYLYAFMKIAVEEYVKRLEDFIYFIRGGEDTNRPYSNLFDAFNSYFTHITRDMLRPKMQPEVPDSKDDIPVMDLKFLKEKEEEEIAALKKKKFNNILNETVKFWEIADKLVKRIEQRDPRVPEPNIKKTERDNSGKEKLIQSNIAEIIRKLELRSLKVRGIESIHTSQLKSESKAEVHQFIVEHYSKGYETNQNFKFISLQSEHLERARNNVFDNDYLQLVEALNEEDFSLEAQTAVSAEKYTSALFESTAQSATTESFKTVSATPFFSTSNDSFMTTNDSLMKSASGSVFASTESYKTDASSAQLNESQLKVNRAKIEAIQRGMMMTLSAQQADKSVQNNFSKPNDVSSLESYIAPDKFRNNSKAIGGRNSSNYADVSHSQYVSIYSVQREYPENFNNMSKDNKFASNQMIAGNA